jgi:iron complex transport system substrate-binding protein
MTLEQKVAAIEMRVTDSPRPRALCLEWIDPCYIAGHWVPEMVAKAGGEDVLGRAGEPSFRATAEQIADTNAEVIVVMPCGYSSKRAAGEFSFTELPSSWDKLPAIRNRRVFAVDANSYFSRPGPRLSDGVELLAHLFHPQIVPLNISALAFQEL